MKPLTKVRKMRIRGEKRHDRDAAPNLVGLKTLRARTDKVERYCRSSIDYDHPCNPHEILRMLWGEQ